MRGCFVTGTDTGVGKSVLSAVVLAGLHAHGRPVRGLKPLLTGLEEPSDPIWPPDHALLASVTGRPADELVLESFGPAVSPHLAAELAGRPLSVAALAEAIRALPDPGEVLVVEGVGGLLVPIGADGDVRALAVALGLPVLVAARPGLGTINHTLLTLEAARTAGLTVAAVVLTPWPEDPDRVQRSNRETIARLGEVEVATLPVVSGPEVGALVAAGAGLPLVRWLALA